MSKSDKQLSFEVVETAPNGAAAPADTSPDYREIPEAEISTRPLLTKKQVAAYCQVSERTIHRNLQLGLLAKTMVGNSVRIHPDDLEAWLNSSRTRANVAAEETRRRRSAPPRADGLRALLDD